MLTYRRTNVFFAALALFTVILARRMPVSSVVYVSLLLAWSLVVFCGCYFIGMNFFLRSVNRGTATEKTIALTFDDGPAVLTPALLDTLKEKNVEATFFCIGRRLAGQEEILRRMVREGHIIGNHSYSHHALFDLFSFRKMSADIEAMAESLYRITGLRPLLFRPPYGVTNPVVARAVRQGRLVSVGWSIRSYDTVSSDPERLLARILRKLRPGGIILLHDTVAGNADLLPRLIDAVRRAGYRLDRLDKMCNLTPYG